MSKLRREDLEVYRLLQQFPDGLTEDEIAQKLNMDIVDVLDILHRLRKAGYVRYVTVEE